MKKITVLTCLLAGLYGSLAAQQPEVIRLWEKRPAPDSNNITADEEDIGGGRLANITVPEISVYRPEAGKNTGKAVLICPGGGYSIVAIEHEGYAFAKFLAENGITGIVLKYRLPNRVNTVPISDVTRAMEVIRENEKRWGIGKNKTGIMGFSAGGHLAGSYTAHARKKGMPAFAILYYPVLSFADSLVHEGSRQQLTGADPALNDYYSVEKTATAKFPPALIFVSDDDGGVNPQNSYLLAQKLKGLDVPVELINYPTGGHGWGFNPGFEYHEQMKKSLLEFLAEIR